MGNLKVDFKCCYSCFSIKLPYNDTYTLFALLSVLTSYRWVNIQLFPVATRALPYSGTFPVHTTLRLCFFRCCQIIKVQSSPPHAADKGLRGIDTFPIQIGASSCLQHIACLHFLLENSMLALLYSSSFLSCLLQWVKISLKKKKK